MAERLNAPVLKTGIGQPIVGSNPTPSATCAQQSSGALWHWEFTGDETVILLPQSNTSLRPRTSMETITDSLPGPLHRLAPILLRKPDLSHGIEVSRLPGRIARARSIFCMASGNSRQARDAIQAALLYVLCAFGYASMDFANRP